MHIYSIFKYYSVFCCLIPATTNTQFYSVSCCMRDLLFFTTWEVNFLPWGDISQTKANSSKSGKKEKKKGGGNVL